jgi:hypothetical protein
MVRAQERKKVDLPAYFDSQAQAAATLGISIYDLKSAKAAGSQAFRAGGRIRTKELQAWLRDNRVSGTDGSNPSHVRLDESPCVNWSDPADRRTPLFELMELLECALHEKQITVEQYCAIGDKTIPLVIKLGRAWDAGIDEIGYKATWLCNKRDFRRKGKRASR